MSKFNATKRPAKPNTRSYEGGAVYTKNPVEDWMNFLFSSYLEDGFYETADEQMNRYMELTQEIGETLGWEFVAKASMFARNELGLRSISELTAAMLNGQSFDEKRAYFRNYFARPDGVSEVFAAIDMIDGKRSHALVRGAADYLSTLSEYQIGKYKMNRKDYNMYDLINITHAHSVAIDAYKDGVLAAPDTWEVAISATENEVEKAKEWKRLVENGKLGYIALVRNLNNILDSNVSSNWIDDVLCPQLVNKTAIKKSKIFPYQIYCTVKNLKVNNYAVLGSLEKAFRIACGNMPHLEGPSAIILDVSGSMEDRISAKSNMSIKEVGAVYAAALYVSTDCDFVKFGNHAKMVNYNRNTNVFDIIEQMQANDGCGYGTDVVPAYQKLSRSYNRIFLISDMQIMGCNAFYWGKSDTATKTAYQEYCNRYGTAKLYSFDLGHYNTQTDNSNNPNVRLLTTLNDKIFTFIALFEDGGNLVDYINNHYTYV